MRVKYRTGQDRTGQNGEVLQDSEVRYRPAMKCSTVQEMTGQ